MGDLMHRFIHNYVPTFDNHFSESLHTFSTPRSLANNSTISLPVKTPTIPSNWGQYPIFARNCFLDDSTFNPDAYAFPFDLISSPVSIPEAEKSDALYVVK